MPYLSIKIISNYIGAHRKKFCNVKTQNSKVLIKNNTK